ncbi:MAG: ABC transporter substrate-binding protein [Methanolobus sp.]
MMKKSLSIFLVGMLLIGVVAISGCTDNDTEIAGTEEETTANDELIAAVGTHGGEPESGFNPITGWGYNHEPLIQSTLFKKDSNGALINDLATDYSVNEDGYTWTVTIRDDVIFHDGEALTAEDVAFTFNTAAEAGGSVDLSMLEKATVIDDNTIEFKLNDNQATFINKLAVIGIVPEHAYDENYGQNPIGSGPYQFVQWDKGQQVILEANPDYYGDEPYFKKLTIVFMEADTAFAAAKSGQIDLAEIPTSYAGQEVDGMKIVALESIDARGISFPAQPDTGETSEDGYAIGNDVTSDVAIRKALNIGIDRQTLVDGALNGQGEEEFTGVDKLPWGNKEAIFEDGNVEEARKILSDAGWEDTDGDGIVEKDGVKAEFTLLYSASAQERQALAVAISEEAKELGINIIPEGSSWDKIDTLALSTPVVFGYGSLDPTDLYLKYYSESYDPSSYNNIIKYSNPTVDSYLRTAITSSDQDIANENWQLAAWDGETGFSPKGDATWMWMATLDYLYIMDEDLDIGTPKYSHMALIFSEISWNGNAQKTKFEVS